MLTSSSLSRCRPVHPGRRRGAVVCQPEQLLPERPQLCHRPAQHACERISHRYSLAGLASDLAHEHCLRDEHRVWKCPSRYVFGVPCLSTVRHLLASVTSDADKLTIGIWMENGSGGFMGGMCGLPSTCGKSLLILHAFYQTWSSTEVRCIPCLSREVHDRSYQADTVCGSGTSSA